MDLGGKNLTTYCECQRSKWTSFIYKSRCRRL